MNGGAFLESDNGYSDGWTTLWKWRSEKVCFIGTSKLDYIILFPIRTANTISNNDRETSHEYRKQRNECKQWCESE